MSNRVISNFVKFTSVNLWNDSLRENAVNFNHDTKLILRGQCAVHARRNYSL